MYKCYITKCNQSINQQGITKKNQAKSASKKITLIDSILCYGDWINGYEGWDGVICKLRLLTQSTRLEPSTAKIMQLNTTVQIHDTPDILRIISSYVVTCVTLAL